MWHHLQQARFKPIQQLGLWSLAAIHFLHQHLKIWQDTILHVITILLKDEGDPPAKRTSEYYRIRIQQPAYFLRMVEIL